MLWRKLYGVSYRTPDGREGYVPIRHPGGGNYDEAVVRRWLQTEFRNKTLIGAGIKHEDHVLRTFGVSLEEQGCQLYDVFHAATLLNERRWRTNLEVLSQEEFGEGKVDLGDTDSYPIHERPAADVAEYAIKDARLGLALKERYTPRLEAEGLISVLQLENDLVYSTVDMERNGSYLDVDLLQKWDDEVTVEFEARILEIHRRTGMAINPNTDDMKRLMRYAGVEHTGFSTEKGNESFAEDAILPWLGENCQNCPECGVNHDIISLALEARQLSSYRAKYTQGYLKKVHADGRIFYALHQMRAESEGAMAGTVVGRYSSSALNKERDDGGINIQQVAKTKKMPKLLQRWPTRRLFIPPAGERWVSSDASQLQFRELAHYAKQLGMPRLAERYNEDPNVDFHNIVMAWTGLNRDFTKNVNYAKLFGGGPGKVAFMCHKTEDEARRIIKKYDREFPEAAAVIQKAERMARTRGYVRTILGRRMRYDVHGSDRSERFYSALAKLLQGTEGDLIKLKIRRLYRERKRLGVTLRSTVHDEVNKTTPNEAKETIASFMSEQEFPMEVPINWDTGIGGSWEDAK
ncbi:MAG TPA: DNA polymerase [Chloroflexota bacterium]|nr:DNA polymerase [Chloroflexota bacterium]